MGALLGRTEGSLCQGLPLVLEIGLRKGRDWRSAEGMFDALVSRLVAPARGFHSTSMDKTRYSPYPSRRAPRAELPGNCDWRARQHTGGAEEDLGAGEARQSGGWAGAAPGTRERICGWQHPTGYSTAGFQVGT